MTVHQGEKRSPGSIVGFAVPLMGFLLLVFAHHFDWPDEQVSERSTMD